MQYERNNAVSGKPVHLWLNTRDKVSKKLVIPDSVGTVDILRESNGRDLLVATLTPTLANPGTYLAVWNIPLDAIPGTYFDRWNDVVIDGGGTSIYVERILVSVPSVETDDPTLNQDYSISLVTREIVQGSITFLNTILLEPKNDVFPKAQARIRNSQGQYTDRWVDVRTKNNEGFIKFDARDVTLGQYFIQLKLEVGEALVITPELSFTVREA